MVIEFRPQTPAQPAPAPPRLVRLPVADQARAEAALFRFLTALLAGEPRAEAPLLLAPATLERLCHAPHPQLVEALRHLLDDLLVDLGPDPARWGRLVVSPACLGLALAAHNALLPSLARPDPAGDLIDPADAFNAALLRTLPPARQVPDLLAYHALLRHPAALLARGDPGRSGLLHALIELSPLTAVARPDLHAPAALLPLARELLPGWRQVRDPAPPFWAPAAWLDTLLPLLADPAAAAWLRGLWLALPQTRPACRGLGLLLEALRRRAAEQQSPPPPVRGAGVRGNRDPLIDLILRFYEAYDHFHGQPLSVDGARPARDWPVFQAMEPLLRLPAHNEAALRVNRRGTEQFLLFWPLVQIIIADGGPPTDYRCLSPALIGRIRGLLPLTTLDRREADERAMDTIRFGGEDGA